MYEMSFIIFQKIGGYAHLYNIKPCQPSPLVAVTLTAAQAAAVAAATVRASSSSSAASCTISKTTGDIAGVPATANGGKKRDPGADDLMPPSERLAILAAAQAETDAEQPAAQSSPGAGYGLPSGVPKRPPMPRAHARAAVRARDVVGGDVISFLINLLLIGDHSRVSIGGLVNNSAESGRSCGFSDAGSSSIMPAEVIEASSCSKISEESPAGPCSSSDGDPQVEGEGGEGSSCC